MNQSTLYTTLSHQIEDPKVAELLQKEVDRLRKIIENSCANFKAGVQREITLNALVDAIKILEAANAEPIVKIGVHKDGEDIRITFTKMPFSIERVISMREWLTTTYPIGFLHLTIGYSIQALEENIYLSEQDIKSFTQKTMAYFQAAGLLND